MSLKTVDDTNTTVEEDDDNYETPNPLYDKLCQTYQIFPKLDVFADSINTKCVNFISPKDNAFFTEWLVAGDVMPFWANPPGTKQLDAIARAEEQVNRYGMKGLMILPSRVLSTTLWHRYIEGKREYHAILGRPVFLKHGKKTKWPAMHAYVVVVWR